MKSIHVAIIGLALAAPSLCLGAAGGISGSVHDFATNAWNIGTSGTNSPGRKATCGACHSAHHTDTLQTAPLWNHANSTLAGFVPYSSPTMDATPGTPAGASLACLSCHDGTVAVNAKIDGTFTGGSAVYIDPAAVISQDLHVTHPISFTYDSALAAADTGLEDPNVYKIGDPKTSLTVQTAPVPSSGWSGTSLAGQTLTKALLPGGKMECSSCHDVHRTEGSSATSGILVRISGTDVDNRGSLLCRTCHKK